MTAVISTLLSLLSIITAAAPNNDQTTGLPNIGYAVKGYNILIGDPMSTSLFYDVGLRMPIFQSVYTFGRKTGDARHMVPDGYYANMAELCDVTFSSEVESNVAQKQRSIESKVKIEEDMIDEAFKAAFTGSTGFKAQAEQMEKLKNKFITTTATCSNYVVTMDTIHKPPNFTEAFVDSLRTLKSGDYAKYLDFIELFGTHFQIRTQMGARYSDIYELSQNDKEWLERAKINIRSSANALSLNRLKVMTNNQEGTDDQWKKAEMFEDKVIDRKVHSYGSKPSANGDSLAWSNAAIVNPLPLKYDLMRIDKLFNDKFMGEILQEGKTAFDYFTVGDNMTKVLDEYCLKVRGKLGISNCNGPDPGCSGGNHCHTNAACNDVTIVDSLTNITKKSYNCTCKKGYVGDGIMCDGWNIQTSISSKPLDFPERSIPKWKQFWDDVPTIPVMCPSSTYAHGVTMLMRKRPFSILGEPLLQLVGVKLHCKQYNQDKGETVVTSGINWDEGHGLVEVFRSCGNDARNYLNGFRIKHDFYFLRAFNGLGQYQINSLNLQCKENAEVLKGHTMEEDSSKWGQPWSKWMHCPVDSRICGVDTRRYHTKAPNLSYGIGLNYRNSGLISVAFLCCGL